MKSHMSSFEKFVQSPENRRLFEQERLLVEVTELLTGILAREGITRSELARRLGKSKAFVTQVLRGRHNMTLRTVADIFGGAHYQILLEAVPRQDKLRGILEFDSPVNSNCYKWSQDFALQMDRSMPAARESSAGMRRGVRRPSVLDAQRMVAA